MRKQKKVRYIFQTHGSDPAETAKKKQALTEQGYLVITVIEGGQAMEKGLRDMIGNH